MAILIGFGSCRKDFDYSSSDGNLTFSSDTVYLDTIFSNIGSSTYSLTVYNKTNQDLSIPFIGLKRGSESAYRLNVEGQPGKQFNDIPINAQDSLYIFIEATITDVDITDNEFLYTDTILFDTSNNEQSVALVTLVKDAILLFPGNESKPRNNITYSTLDENGNTLDFKGFELRNEELRFTNEKPYVIYGYAVVNNDKELLIDAGARVYFHADSGLLILEDGTVQINGALSENQKFLEGEVIFEGNRLEPAFSDIPGQWGTIIIQQGLKENSLEHFTIKNASIGLWIDGNSNTNTKTTVIKNAKIHNSNLHNLWSKTGRINAQNIIFGGAGNSSVYLQNGGNLDFTHCTIANYWNKGFRVKPSLEINNISLNTDQESSTTDISFKNSIIYGSGTTELSILKVGEKVFNFNFENCAIKFDPSVLPNSDNYNFDNDINYRNIVLNVQPDFFLPFENDFRIGPDSDFINLGNLEIANQVPYDIINTLRTTSPDLGAYQFQNK